MKTMKVLDVVNINRVMDGVMLSGAPMADVKAVMRFRREAKPIVDGWNDIIKDAIEKLKGENITEDELNKHLNEALADEAMREVEITPFVISADGEDAIIAQSKIACGDLDVIKAALRPDEEKKEDEKS